MSERGSWNDLRDEALASPEGREAYDAARIRFELGRTVRERREALGMTQAQLAQRAGMLQPAVARFEAGGTMPTLPLLERFAVALGMRLHVGFEPLDRAGFETPRRGARRIRGTGQAAPALPTGRRLITSAISAAAAHSPPEATQTTS